jgi:hypothetical protein
MQGAPPFQTLPHCTTSRLRLYSPCLESIVLHTYVRTVSYHSAMSVSLTVQTITIQDSLLEIQWGGYHGADW